MHRRSMLISSAAAVVAPVLPQTVMAAWTRHGHLGLERPMVVRQQDVRASVAFAAGAGYEQASMFDVADDVGSVLYGPRSYEWRQADRAICGLCTVSVWFCMVQAAADAGYRPIYHEVHERSFPLERAVKTGRETRLRVRNDANWRPVGALTVEISGDSLVSWLLVPRHAIA